MTGSSGFAGFKHGIHSNPVKGRADDQQKKKKNRPDNSYSVVRPIVDMIAAIPGAQARHSSAHKNGSCTFQTCHYDEALGSRLLWAPPMASWPSYRRIISFINLIILTECSQSGLLCLITIGVSTSISYINRGTRLGAARFGLG